MNRRAPPAKAKPLWHEGLCKLRWRIAYWVSGVLLPLFHEPCWSILKWRSRLEDARDADEFDDQEDKNE
jgi:hypothetical protein